MIRAHHLNGYISRYLYSFNIYLGKNLQIKQKGLKQWQFQALSIRYVKQLMAILKDLA